MDFNDKTLSLKLRFFLELEEAISEGYEYQHPDFFYSSSNPNSVKKGDILNNILGVIKKYSANPHEPITDENNNK